MRGSFYTPLRSRRKNHARMAILQVKRVHRIVRWRRAVKMRTAGAEPTPRALTVSKETQDGDQGHTCTRTDSWLSNIKQKCREIVMESFRDTPGGAKYKQTVP